MTKCNPIYNIIYSVGTSIFASANSVTKTEVRIIYIVLSMFKGTSVHVLIE